MSEAEVRDKVNMQTKRPKQSKESPAADNNKAGKRTTLYLLLLVGAIILSFLAGIIFAKKSIAKAEAARNEQFNQFVEETLSSYEDITSYETSDYGLQLVIERSCWDEVTAKAKDDLLTSLQFQLTKARNQLYTTRVDYYPIVVTDLDNITLAEINRQGVVSISY